MKNQKKSISKKLHEAYWQGVTDVIGCISLGMTFGFMFVYGFFR